MSTKPDSQSPPAAPEVVGKTGIGRRRLLRAGLSAAPVALALSGRSAMAVPTFNDPNCPKGLSPLAWASVSPDGTPCGAVLSHTVGRNTLGRSPGFWRPNKSGQTFQEPGWPASFVSPFSSYLTKGNTEWRDIPWDDPRYGSGTLFSTIFTTSSDTRTFSQILIQESGNSAGNLKWFLCAAYLNSLVFTNYSLTSQEVIDIYTNTLQIQNVNGFLKQTWS